MATVNIIKRVDINDGVDINYKEVTNYYDGSPMSDDKCDGVVFRKARDGKYFQRQFDKTINQNIVKKTITELRSITPSEILMLKMGIYKGVEVRGYHVEKDTPAPIIYTLSESTKEEDGGRLIEVNSGEKFEHIFKDVIDVKYYGATPETADSSEIINKVMEEAKTSSLRVFFSDVYKAKNNIKIFEGIHVAGISKSICGITSTGNVTFSTDSNVTISDILIENKSSLRNALYGRDQAAPTVVNCTIRGRVNYMNNSKQVLSGAKIHFCDIEADFENDYDGKEQYDVLAFYGYFGNKITHNRINVKNVHRLFKFSKGNFGGEMSNDWQTSLTNARDILIEGNTITGSGGKQMIDAFNASSVIKLINNHFELVNDPLRGSKQWTTILNTKTANDARDIEDIGDAVIIEGNTGTIPCGLMWLQGSYGANHINYSGNRYNTVRVVNNHLRCTSDTVLPDGFINIRYYNDVTSSGNTFEVKSITGNVVYNLMSNENVHLDKSDTYVGGVVRISSAKQNAQLVKFTGEGKDITVQSLIKNYDENASVIVQDADIERIKIDGVRSYPRLDAERNCRIASFNNNIRIDKLLIKNCEATSKTGGNVIPIYDNIAKTNLTEIDNNWQPRFRGFVTELPTIGTYQRGDTLKRSNSAIGLANEWVCVTGNSTGGVWRAISWTTGNGRTANRPTLTASDVGVEYYDTDLQKFVKWTGSAWVEVENSTNSAISVTENIVLRAIHSGKVLQFNNESNITVNITNLPTMATVSGVKNSGAGTVTIIGTTAPSADNMMNGVVNSSFSLIKNANGTSNLLISNK